MVLWHFGDCFSRLKMTHPKADLLWRDGKIPVSTQFDDPYYSLASGLEETRHVFLAGNDLPERFCDGFHIAELGFGTGLNFLTTLLAWRKAGIQGRFHFTSFEAFPMQPDEMIRAQMEFADLHAIIPECREIWEDVVQGVPVMRKDFAIEVVLGDARDTLPYWENAADAWFLDGFSPVKNPELWSPELMQSVYKKTHAHGTAATYTAAGFVRRGLADAGFIVERIKGFAHKRHMTRAFKDNTNAE
jgi:tRNA U34 5-methylaminomethyl-2-thiouridine-forming methyltransferase MnmC